MHTHTHTPPHYLSHIPHDGKLLGVDEALQEYPDGHVDVVLQHVLPQVDAGMGLCHTDDGLYVAHSDGDTACALVGGGGGEGGHVSKTCVQQDVLVT